MKSVICGHLHHAFTLFRGHSFVVIYMTTTAGCKNWSQTLFKTLSYLYHILCLQYGNSFKNMHVFARTDY